MIAVATIGFPDSASQLNSQAFQISSPWKGKSSPSPSASRAG
jgi:hypothetical protein